MEEKKYPKLSIIIPCFNEAKNIPILLERFSQAICNEDIELILVNNGSVDESPEVLETLIPKYKFARVVNIEVNQGYGLGILKGLHAARGEFLAWTHADLQTDPYDIIKALRLCEEASQPKKIFIKGLRQKRQFIDKFFTWSMAIFESIYLGVPLRDINAQPNFFHRSFFERWENPPNDFSLDLYAFYMAHKHNLKVVRFPVIFRKRIYGSSKWNFGWKSRSKFIKRTLNFSCKLKKDLLK